MKRIPDREPGAAFKACHITQAQGRAVHHEPVSGLHASVVVIRGQDNRPVRGREDFLISLPVRRVPPVRLCGTGNRDYQTYIRMQGAQPENFTGGDCIKPAGSAAQERSVS